MGSSASVLTGFHQTKRRDNNESFSTMSRGLLIPDHVLLRRQQILCQEMLETPDVSEEVVSNSH